MRTKRSLAVVAGAIALPLFIGGAAYGVQRASNALEQYPNSVVVEYRLRPVNLERPMLPPVAPEPGPTAPAPGSPTPLAIEPAIPITDDGASTNDGENAPSEIDFSEPAGFQRASLVRVIDGDTIVVNLGGVEERVRLVDIDTPERGAAGFNEATAFTRNAIADAGNVVYLQQSGNNRDRFDRLRRNVWLRTEEGFVLLNDMLVASGHARVWILR